MTTTDDEVTERIAFYFLIVGSLLALVLVLAKWLHHQAQLNTVLSEAALVLLVGMAFGFLIEVCVNNGFQNNNAYGDDDDGVNLTNPLLSFNTNIFFLALLPPILFNSGYQLRRELFYRHITPIVSFACLGTVLSSMTTALALYGIEQLFDPAKVFGFAPTLLELVTFGSLIAATDTVSVLGIFQQKHVDPHLFNLVFGESALNDAVAIVLFKSFSTTLERNTIHDRESLLDVIFELMADILIQGVCSPLLGVVCSFGTAILFKHTDFKGLVMLELSLYILMMYFPFILAENLGLSGIVTIFFSGLSARRYIAPNISVENREMSNTIFKLTAYLSETCIFLNLGLSIFGFSGSFHWRFICWSFAAALLGRAISVYPISLIYNMSLRKQQPQAGDEDDENDIDKELPGVFNVCPGDLEQTDDQNDTVQAKHKLGNASMKSKKSKKSRKSKTGDDASVASQASWDSWTSWTSKSSFPTPTRVQDKYIPVNFMHMLWFAGLRGAVAYACARQFPDIHGHNDEIIAATMTIVLVTIILMGGFVGPLLRILKIQVNVDEESYMKEWHRRRKLKGMFHKLEYNFIYKRVVKRPDRTALEKHLSKRSNKRKQKPGTRQDAGYEEFQDEPYLDVTTRINNGTSPTHHPVLIELGTMSEDEDHFRHNHRPSGGYQAPIFNNSSPPSPLR